MTRITDLAAVDGYEARAVEKGVNQYTSWLGKKLTLWTGFSMEVQEKGSTACINKGSLARYICEKYVSDETPLQYKHMVRKAIDQELEKNVSPTELNDFVKSVVERLTDPAIKQIVKRDFSIETPNDAEQFCKALMSLRPSEIPATRQNERKYIPLKPGCTGDLGTVVSIVSSIKDEKGFAVKVREQMSIVIDPEGDLSEQIRTVVETIRDKAQKPIISQKDASSSPDSTHSVDESEDLPTSPASESIRESAEANPFEALSEQSAVEEPVGFFADLKGEPLPDSKVSTLLAALKTPDAKKRVIDDATQWIPHLLASTPEAPSPELQEMLSNKGELTPEARNLYIDTTKTLLRTFLETLQQDRDVTPTIRTVFFTYCSKVLGTNVHLDSDSDSDTNGPLSETYLMPMKGDSIGIGFSVHDNRFYTLSMAKKTKEWEERANGIGTELNDEKVRLLLNLSDEITDFQNEFPHNVNWSPLQEQLTFLDTFIADRLLKIATAYCSEKLVQSQKQACEQIARREPVNIEEFQGRHSLYMECINRGMNDDVRPIPPSDLKQCAQLFDALAQLENSRKSMWLDQAGSPVVGLALRQNTQGIPELLDKVRVKTGGILKHSLTIENRVDLIRRLQALQDSYPADQPICRAVDNFVAVLSDN